MLVITKAPHSWCANEHRRPSGKIQIHRSLRFFAKQISRQTFTLTSQLRPPHGLFKIQGLSSDWSLAESTLYPRIYRVSRGKWLMKQRELTVTFRCETKNYAKTFSISARWLDAGPRPRTVSRVLQKLVCWFHLISGLFFRDIAHMLMCLSLPTTRSLSPRHHVNWVKVGRAKNKPKQK